MIVITGDTRKLTMLKELQELRWGRMFIDRRPTPYDGEPWGFDNGAFVAWKHRLPWDADAYRRRLERAQSVGVPYMSVVPDIVGAGVRSLEFSLSWLGVMPTEWPRYLAVQDGMTYQDVIAVIDQFDGLFLGGTDAFKVTAKDWCNMAHDHGKPFHYARAGILRRVDHALRCGADSLDSAFPLWTMRRFWQFVRHLQGDSPQLVLFGEEIEGGARDE